MNLRIATENDKKQLYCLWSEVFGDSESDIDLFFDSVIKTDNTVVAETDGKIVSALYLIEAEIIHEETAYKAYYVYAAATDKQYRRQGIMAKLLDYSSYLANERHIDYLFLHPAEEKLYDYYLKNGFKTAFYDEGDEISSNPLNNAHSFVKWGKEVIELDRKLYGDESTEDEKKKDTVCPERTGMIKKINGTAPEIECAYLGITLE